MANLTTKIKLYLENEDIDFTKQVIVNDDGDGKPYIFYWDNSLGKPKPTDEQLNVFEDEGNTKDNLADIINKRRNEYPSIEECVHAILDDDLTSLQEKRTLIKNKYPKE